MNTYYELLKYLKFIFEQDDRVANVVTGDFEEWRRDMFPLVHIDVTDAPFTNILNTSTDQFNVTVNVLDIRDVNKEDFKDRFWHQDTRHDSWNDTFSILKLARNRFIKDHYETDVNVTAYTSAERITYQFQNGLDGWQQTWTIDVPDTFTSVCYGD